MYAQQFDRRLAISCHLHTLADPAFPQDIFICISSLVYRYTTRSIHLNIKYKSSHLQSPFKILHSHQLFPSIQYRLTGTSPTTTCFRPRRSPTPIVLAFSIHPKSLIKSCPFPHLASKPNCCSPILLGEPNLQSPPRQRSALCQAYSTIRILNFHPRRKDPRTGIASLLSSAAT